MHQHTPSIALVGVVIGFEYSWKGDLEDAHHMTLKKVLWDVTWCVGLSKPFVLAIELSLHMEVAWTNARYAYVWSILSICQKQLTLVLPLHSLQVLE
jgi:hypothetical protein